MLNADISSKQEIARERLSRIVNDGQRQAAGVVASIMHVQPKDELVRTAESNFLRVERRNQLVTPIGNDVMSDHSFGQLCDRLSPRLRAYAGVLQDGSADRPWQAELLQTAINEHMSHSQDRMLVRHVDGQVRGVLSDTYKRIDSRPLLDAFIGAASSVGAIMVSGFATETRNSVRAILPRVIEPIPGEAMVLGIHWGNSDYGSGAYALSAFAIRLVCLNGMVGDTQLKKVHLGSRLAEGTLDLSNETLDLDHRTLGSATTDVVRALLSADAVEQRVAAVRAAAAKETTFEAAWTRVGKALTKGDKNSVQAAYEGPDTLNLPEGQNMWRFSNALSFVANTTGISPDKKLELQALAGQAVAGF